MSLAEFFCIGLIGVLAGVVVSLVFILFGLGAYYGLTVSIPGVGLALASTAVILTVTTAGLIGLRVTAAP